MKKIFLTFILCTVIVLTSFTFGACSGTDNYTGNEYLLEEISATYEDTVSAEDKQQCERLIESVRGTIGSDNTPYCRFYTIYETVLTNCNGINRLSKYKVDGGNVSIDTSTLVTQDKFKLPYQSMKFCYNSSLENAVFKSENGKLVMTESIEGVNLKYVFGENGKINESPDVYPDNNYYFLDITYWHYTTDETKDEKMHSLAKSYAKDYLSTPIKFPNVSTCKIGELSYNLEFSEKSEHSAKLISQNSGMTLNSTTMLFYGDLLIRVESGSGTPFCIYFLKSK